MRSVRLRLLILALLPLVVLLPLLLGVTMVRWINKFDELLLAKVASDLRVAEQYFGRIEATQAADIAALAQSGRFERAQTGGDAALLGFLEAEQARMGLDLLIYGALEGDDIPKSAHAVAERAQPDTPSAGLAIFSGQELGAISPELAQKAELTLVATEAARKIDRTIESRGMMLLAAHRSLDTGNILIGGRLLNQNLDVIDTMNELIYQEEENSETRQGTTTLFLDDVRISTNVRLFEGSRALGTRVSEVVWQQVMQEGKPWLDRAFVVNDWYISGYVPVTDSDGTRIGMLYTGFLESPFTSDRNTTILSLILAFIAVICISVPLFLWLARGIFSPLEQMTATMARAEQGEFAARIGKVDARDEIGTVARHLDRLLDQVQERDETLRGYADNLNELVDQRTAELQDAKQKLEATFAQLVMSEKLASIGEITAGVAHEINNPVAVIQGNLDVLRRTMDPGFQAEHKTELDLIDAQTHRINVIVGKLLNFTRPEEISDVSSHVDVAKCADDALVLVTPDLRKHSIETETAHAPAPSIMIVASELVQVLVNLMINASQAMPDGGSLRITTRAAKRDGVPGAEIIVADSGPGIPKEKLDNVFDPFFTTKPAEGTGLGLSISQTLITHAGGLITVKSEEGVGSKFFVWCPTADNSSDPHLKTAK